jgi:TatD DNase family protein
VVIPAQAVRGPSEVKPGTKTVAEPGLALVDSHCHIDMPDFDADRDEVVARARAAGLAEMLVVGGFDQEGGHQRALETAARYGLPATAGVHPHEARVAEERTYDELRALGREGRIVAVGEIGLDFHYDHSPRDVQREVFRRQLRLARQLRLPVVVHTREADAETIDILEQEGAAEAGGVIHCFTGGLELARRALAIGFYLSFSGIVAFPRAEVIQQVARECPEDRLLVETDAPFLAPPPHRGKRNEPAFVVEVARKLASLRGSSFEAVGEAVLRNYARLFRRPL